MSDAIASATDNGAQLPQHSPANGDSSPLESTVPTSELAPLPAVLTIEELSAYLRLNHKTIRDAIARGEIPGVRRIGGAIRIHRDTVLGWLSAGQGRVAGSSRRLR